MPASIDSNMSSVAAPSLRTIRRNFANGLRDAPTGDRWFAANIQFKVGEPNLRRDLDITNSHRKLAVVAARGISCTWLPCAAGADLEYEIMRDGRAWQAHLAQLDLHPAALNQAQRADTLTIENEFQIEGMLRQIRHVARQFESQFR